MLSPAFLRQLSICLFCLFQIVSIAYASDEENYSSSDTLKVQNLLDVAYDLELSNPDSAILLYDLARKIAEKIDYKIGMGRAILYTGIVLSDQGRYDESIGFYQQAIEVFRAAPYLSGVGSSYVNIGNIYKRKAEYARALDNYIEGTRVFEHIRDTSRLIYAYSNIGAVLSDVELYDESLEYNERSLELSLVLKDSLSICDALINIGMIDQNLGLKEEAMIQYNRALAIAEKIENFHILHLCYYNKAEMSIEQNEPQKAHLNSKRGLDYALKSGNLALVSSSLAQYGFSFIEIEMLDSASYYLKSAIDLAEENESQETLILAYLWMAKLYEKFNKAEASLLYYKKYQSLQNEATGDRQRRLTAGLEIEYETAKKDIELSEKTLEIEKNEALLAKRNALIFALTGALLTILLLFFLIRRSLQQKRTIAEKEAQLQEEKVEQLKKEQQVIALQSMLEGEEKERARLAKDLHDGLGGMLSSTKMHFSSIAAKNKSLGDSESYQKAIELLDQTSNEARKISHNLMPGALEKYGLIEALSAFCENLNASKELQVDFQSFGFDERLEEVKEIMIYRIVLELVNNVLKHSEASELIVQLMRSEKALNITVEDNGKGFAKLGKEKEGIGLANIRSRVNYLSGKLDIDSKIGEGTSINIEITL